MKKNMIVGIVIAVGMLSIGALSASAAASDSTMATCSDKQAYQQFTQETAGLASAIKAKDMELRALYGYDSINIHKVDALEAELKVLKAQVNAAAQKHGIPACCKS